MEAGADGGAATGGGAAATTTGLPDPPAVSPDGAGGAGDEAAGVGVEGAGTATDCVGLGVGTGEVGSAMAVPPLIPESHQTSTVTATAVPLVASALPIVRRVRADLDMECLSSRVSSVKEQGGTYTTLHLASTSVYGS